MYGSRCGSAPASSSEIRWIAYAVRRRRAWPRPQSSKDASRGWREGCLTVRLIETAWCGTPDADITKTDAARRRRPCHRLGRSGSRRRRSCSCRCSSHRTTRRYDHDPADLTRRHRYDERPRSPVGRDLSVRGDLPPRRARRGADHRRGRARRSAQRFPRLGLRDRQGRAHRHEQPSRLRLAEPARAVHRERRSQRDPCRKRPHHRRRASSDRRPLPLAQSTPAG